jgi:SM-20-related protein
LTQALQLNPDLDVSGFAEAYAQRGVVRMPQVLAPASARVVADLLERQTPWRLVVSNPDGPGAGLYDSAQIQAMADGVLNAKLAAVAERARSGFAYMYLSYPMVGAYLSGWNPGHPIHALTEWLNGPAFLGLLRQVTGRGDIVHADAQATLYRPGDFLNLHDDASGETGVEKRLAAYVFGFTRAWRPDWGGQLLFHGADGEIEQGLSPAFNSLTLFRVPRTHSVAAVAPYAGGPRLSLTGWARSDQPPRQAPTLYRGA